MRIIAAVAAIVLMAVPAYAQMGGGRGKQQQGAQGTKDKAPKADEQAYKDALKRIPAPTEKPDPWKTMR